MTVKNNIYVFVLFIFAQLTLLTSAVADETTSHKGGFSTFIDNVTQTWNEPEHYDLYVPAITWHARFAYDKEKTDRYNERPWGAGFGQSRWDDKGNWHGLYLMALKIPITNGNLSAAMAGRKPGVRWQMIISIWVWGTRQALRRVITGNTSPSRCCYRWRQSATARRPSR